MGPGSRLRFALSDQYQGIGGSEGLERGLLVYVDDKLLVEEGMGLGICALQAGGFTYFSSIEEIHSEAQSHRAQFRLNKRLIWKIWGVPSVILTRLLESVVTHTYMKHEHVQPGLLRLGTVLSNLFRVEAHFMPVSSQGQVNVTYQVHTDKIVVVIDAKTAGPRCRLFVMNELGGTLFDQALADGISISPPTGWQRMTGTGASELYSRTNALAFTITELHVPPNVQSTLYWGREVTSRYCWAGFESDLECTDSEIRQYTYAIRFREANA